MFVFSSFLLHPTVFSLHQSASLCDFGSPFELLSSTKFFMDNFKLNLSAGELSFDDSLPHPHNSFVLLSLPHPPICLEFYLTQGLVTCGKNLFLNPV